MARMVLDQPAGLPAKSLAEALRAQFPGFRWQVGDGPADMVQPLDRPTSILGRSGESMVMLGIEPVDAPLDPPDGAPPHRVHLRLTGPSTDDRAMAEQLLLLFGRCMAALGGGALQLEQGGPWLGAQALGSTVPPAGDAPDPAPSARLSPVPAPSHPPFPRGTGTDRPPFGRKKA